MALVCTVCSLSSHIAKHSPNNHSDYIKEQDHRDTPHEKTAVEGSIIMTAGGRTGAPSSGGGGRTTTTKSPSSSLKKKGASAASAAKPKVTAKPKGGKGGIAARGAKVSSSPSVAGKGGKQAKPVVKGGNADKASAKGKGVKRLQAKGKRPPREVSKDSEKPKKKTRGKKRKKVAVTLVDPDTEDEEPGPPSKKRREETGRDGHAASEGAAAESAELRPFYESVEAFLEANSGSWELLPDTKVSRH